MREVTFFYDFIDTEGSFFVKTTFSYILPSYAVGNSTEKI